MSEHHPPASSPSRPRLLVSNDDGVSSFFLRALVEALVRDYEVVVVAPAEEQSWVGRGVTRRGTLKVQPLEDWPCEAWSVSGTPSDCVQVGLHHILGEMRRPHAVVSGMNLGVNITLNLTLGSGTVAAATEGAFAGLPSIAFSLGIDGDKFAEVSGARGHRDEAGDAITRVAAERCRQLTHELISAELNRAEGARPFVVHNVNLPPQVSLETPVRRTCSARALMPSLFERVSSEAPSEHPSQLSSKGESFELRFSFARDWSYLHNPPSSDLEVYRAGEISHCVLDWRELGS